MHALRRFDGENSRACVTFKAVSLLSSASDYFVFFSHFRLVSGCLFILRIFSYLFRILFWWLPLLGAPNTVSADSVRHHTLLVQSLILSIILCDFFFWSYKQLPHIFRSPWQKIVFLSDYKLGILGTRYHSIYKVYNIYTRFTWTYQLIHLKSQCVCARCVMRPRGRREEENDRARAQKRGELCLFELVSTGRMWVILICDIKWKINNSWNFLFYSASILRRIYYIRLFG